MLKFLLLRFVVIILNLNTLTKLSTNGLKDRKLEKLCRLFFAFFDLVCAKNWLFWMGLALNQTCSHKCFQLLLQNLPTSFCCQRTNSVCSIGGQNRCVHNAQ